MGGYPILYSLSLAVYTFGALAFAALAVTYWRERRLRKDRGGPLLAAFTLACGAALLLSLAQEWNLPGPIDVLHGLVTGIIPALLVHLVYRQAGGRRRGWGIAALYAAGLAAAVAAERSDALGNAPAWVLGSAALAGLGILARPASPAAANAGRRVRALLLALLALSAGLNLAVDHPTAALAPDYLLLAFLAATLYYQERLAFFDVLVKRGAFFAVGLLALSLFEPWRQALLLMPFWLAGPWISLRMDRAIERLWLHRRYSAAEAERRFVSEVQGAANEADLAARAERVASEIFRTRARIGDRIELEPRPDGIPFLSDDTRIVESLSRTLAILRENVRFRELTSRAELTALRAQINPHFLFNALNAIAGLIPGAPALAEETVERLADVFRYTLRQSDKEWVRLEEEMDFVAAYLAIEQARFGDRLAVEIAVADGVGAARIPAMSIQPLVENAIKHGTSAVERTGRVRVAAEIAGNVLRVEVSDNGPGFGGAPGFDAASHAGHGLRNVRERLAGYYGGAARLAWEDAGPGARVWIEMPAVREAARCAF